MTLQEFDLLVLLARSAGRLVSQSELTRGLWLEISPRRKRHLSVLIARLRSRLADSDYRITTVRKRGYGLMPATDNPVPND